MEPQRLSLVLLVGMVLSQSFAITATAALPMSAEQVLDQALAARGGKQAALAVRSFHAKGRVCFMTGEGPWYGRSITNVWPVEVFALRPNKWRVATDLITTPEGAFAFVPPRYYPNGFDGQNAWEALPGAAPQTLDGVLGRERSEQAACFGWCDRLENYQSTTNLGETLFEGRRCQELKLVNKSGSQETHYYDSATHLLTGIVRSSLFGPSLERLVLSEYREFGGFQFPTRIAYRAEDERDQAHLNAIEEFSAFEINCLEETAFARPQKPAPLVRAPAPHAGDLTEAEVQTMLRDWVDNETDRRAIVVGLLDEHGQRVIPYGPRWNFQPGLVNMALAKVFGHGAIDRGPSIDGDTPMGLASVTKVFTRLLLLDMVQRGEMRLDDPVQQYLPASVRMPTRNGKAITLLHLATHTSGLPAWVQGDTDTFEHLYAALTRQPLHHEPGEAYEYSNIGMALLGHIIALKAGQDYETLVQERICRPIGMQHTHVRPNYGLLPGAGALSSTARDMLTLAAAYLGLAHTNLPPLLRHAYLIHGGNDSFTSSLVVDPVHRRGVVMLAYPSTLNVERMILNRFILNQSPKPREAFPANVKDYDRYVGQYLLNNNSTWLVRRTGNHLWIQKPRQPGCELYPLSESMLANQLWGLGFSFEPPGAGRPPQLRVYDLDRQWELRGSRLSTTVPVREKAARLAPEFAQDCTGKYQSADGLTLVVRQDGKTFTAEGNTHSPKQMELYELRPASETFFLSQYDPAFFTLLRGPDGQVTGLIQSIYDLHRPFTKVGPLPAPVAGAVTDRIIGTWESTVEMNAKTYRILFHIAKARGAYHTTVDIIGKDLTGVPIHGPVFLDSSSLYLYGVFVNLGVFCAALNEAATEMSGTWKEGQNVIPLTFKRTGSAP